MSLKTGGTRINPGSLFAIRPGRIQEKGLAFFAALVLLYAFLWLTAIEPPLEDAFISMHCARNLVRGNGLVFNPGERIEAISNPLWTLMLAGMGWIVGDYLTASKALGFVFGLITLAWLWTILRKASNDWKIPAFGAALLLFSPYFLTFTAYGLESPLQTALFLGLLGGLLEQRWIVAGTMLGLLPACRPEGLFFVPLVYLAALAGDRRKVRWGEFLLPGILLTGALILFRLIYYHDILPNTVHSKSIAIVADRWGYWQKASAGVRHLSHFFLDGRFFLWLPALIVGAVLGLRGKPDPSKAAESRRRWQWLAILAGIQVVFVALSGGNVFLRYRFLSGIYPLLCLAAGWALAAMAESRPGWKHTPLVAALAILATLGQVEYERSGRLYWKTRLDTLQSYRSIPAFVKARFHSMGAMPPTLNARLGEIVRASFPEGTWIATGQIGQIGFYGQRPIIDTVGLADRTIARNGVSLEYILSRDPAVLILLGSPHLLDAPNVGVDSGLLGLDEFRKRYQWTRVYQSEPPTETFYWIERRGEPLNAAPREADRYERTIVRLGNP